MVDGSSLASKVSAPKPAFWLVRPSAITGEGEKKGVMFLPMLSRSDEELTSTCAMFEISSRRIYIRAGLCTPRSLVVVAFWTDGFVVAAVKCTSDRCGRRAPVLFCEAMPSNDVSHGLHAGLPPRCFGSFFAALSVHGGAGR